MIDSVILLTDLHMESHPYAYSLLVIVWCLRPHVNLNMLLCNYTTSIVISFFAMPKLNCYIHLINEKWIYWYSDLNIYETFSDLHYYMCCYVSGFFFLFCSVCFFFYCPHTSSIAHGHTHSVKLLGPWYYPVNNF